MFTWKRIVLAVIGIFILFILLTSAILPSIIIDKAQEWVAEETGRSLEIEGVSINPLGLSAEIRGFKLSDKDHSKKFVAWDRLLISLSSASIFHRAPIIDELSLDKPEIMLQRLTENTFNFSDLIPAPGNEPQESTGEPLLFSVNNLSINNGRIDLIDNSLDQTQHHVIEDLQLALPAIGNLPYMVENPVQPLLRAVVNDSPFNIEGQLKPFTDFQEMQFDLKLDNIDLPQYLSYVPVELPVKLRNGKLNLDLDILYRLSPQTGAEIELNGKVDLISVNIWDSLNEQLFFLPLLQVEIAPSQPLKQDIHLSSLRIYNLEVQLNRDRQGVWNHARMASSKQDPAPADAAEQAASPFKLRVDTIEVRDGVVFFEDNLPEQQFKTVARDINIDVNEFALDAAAGIPLTLSLETDRKESVQINGHFLLDPLTLSLHNDINNISLGAYEPYYKEFYNKPLGGTLSLDASLMVTPEQPLLISEGAVSVRDLSGSFNEHEGFRNSTFDVSGLLFDMGRNRLDIDTVNSAGAYLNFSRSRSGEWSFMSRNFPSLAKLAEASETPSPAEKADDEPGFSYRIGELKLTDWNVDFSDNQPAEPAHLQMKNIALSLQNLAMPEKTPSPLKFSAEVPPRGQVAINGNLVLADQSASIETSLKRLPLKAIGPYVAEQTNLVLTNGYLNAEIGTRIVAADAIDLQFDGKLGVNRMHLLDGTHREDLMKWDSLQVAGIKGKLEPLSLSIDSVTLSDYFAKVLIDENATINLVDAFSKDTAESPGAEAESAAEKGTDHSEEPTEEPAELPDIKIDKVVLQGGQVDFTDRSLPRPFHADMRELGGRIDGLSSELNSRAILDLRGNLRNQSPLNITGQINPLAEDLFLDIELSFRDIEMTPFSPYTGNYVGYLIEKGKLNLSLDYFVEDNQLKAKNKVFLDQFDFGASVESENAVSLPVKLAVALLKDGKGEIHLDIPVYGSLDDPQFSITSVVWTVIKNLLLKAATSPFALLGALVGGGEEDFSSISFEYGSARLSAAEQDKLLRMAKALLDRPSLDVEISGFIDPGNDPEGYRREQLSMKVRRLKYLDLVDDEKLPEGATEEDIHVPAEEYADYLWDVYRDEEFPKPRNFVGMTKKLPEDEMEKLIYANTEVNDKHLAQLAQDRAFAVQNFFIEAGQLPQERIFLKEPDISAAPDEETAYRARVELGANVH